MNNRNGAGSVPDVVSDNRLTVAVFSLDTVPGDVGGNLRRVDGMFHAMPRGVDIVVLPELFTTSFMKNTDRMLFLAEDNGGATMEFISHKASCNNIMIAGSFLAKEDRGEDMATGYFNRGFMVTDDGRKVFYDKHHLFCLSKEAELLVHGRRRPPVVAFRGWNVSMLICYELRFPVWSRNVGMQADIVLVPANWPCNRGYAWRQLLIARAIENQSVVVGADRSGHDDYGTYDGLSMMADELGRQIVPKPESAPHGCPLPDNYGNVTGTPYGQILTATFSLGNIRKLRDRLPTVRDADPFRFTDTTIIK